uniref:Uncharacterized protein n=1 Tax=Timema monikensis TaxID=170555 RepID=A0A7R9HPY6_9NEOP|nr:unnamed protein product [Timema monikensis]
MQLGLDKEVSLVCLNTSSGQVMTGVTFATHYPLEFVPKAYVSEPELLHDKDMDLPRCRFKTLVENTAVLNRVFPDVQLPELGESTMGYFMFSLLTARNETSVYSPCGSSTWTLLVGLHRCYRALH